jgi:small subunit ribosomal protein S4
MANNIRPDCRLCRREGMKLFLKGIRCDTDKCAVTRRQGPPGMIHTARRGKTTDYGLHLREKQKVKHYYGVQERQFRRYFARAERTKGNTGDALLTLLESRLDNVFHRLGFAASRSQARQMIRHGNVTINGSRVDIPSYLVRPGEVISVKNQPKLVEAVQANLSENKHQIPDFLAVVPGALPEGHVLRHPGVEDASIPVQVQLILEFCSK